MAERHKEFARKGNLPGRHVSAGRIPAVAKWTVETAMPIAFVRAAGDPAGITSTATKSWGEMIELLSAPTVGKKDGPGWVPARIPIGPRKSECVEEVSMLVLDIEAETRNDPHTNIKTVVGPEPPPMQEVTAEMEARGLRYIAHTSHSHRDPEIQSAGQHHRYRIVLALSRPMAPGEVKAIAHHVAGVLGLGESFDRSAAEPSRLFYLPRCPAERQHLFEAAHGGGRPLDVDKALAELAAIEDAKKGPSVARGRAAGGGWEQVKDAFNAVHDVGAVLEAHEYRRAGNRWLHPGSTTGMPGVRLLPNTSPPAVFSSHAGDPLNDGRPHDAFDIFKILEHGGDLRSATEAAALDLGINFHWREARDPAGETASKAPEAVCFPQDPVDPFAQHALAPFPVHLLPDAIAVFARETAAQSGFDAGAYAFAAMIEAFNMIDHGARLKISDSWKTPCFVWGALVDPSGGGKSPVMNAVCEYTSPVYDEIKADSRREYAKWEAARENLAKGEPPPPKPPYVQRATDNTTVEGLAVLANATPAGINIRADEMTELVGRMDAYHSGGGQQDRASFLHAYDGGTYTITRQSRHTHIENWSVGILTGIQPERLGAMFRKSAQASDGLLQRFFLYMMPAAGAINLNSRYSLNTKLDIENLYRRLSSLEPEDLTLELDHAAVQVYQDAANDLGTVAKRTSAPRFREHLNKTKGFLGRIALGLHVVRHAAERRDTPPPAVVLAQTVDDARQILIALIRHAEAAYKLIDSETDAATALVRAAAEAILAKGWAAFHRGDLTRHATGWRGADSRAAENGLDLLIEFGWIRDVTPSREPGQRGRRSDGTFEVNPKVHTMYLPHAERIRNDRAARAEAIARLSAVRRDAISKS